MWQLDSDNSGSPSGFPESYGDPLNMGEIGDVTQIYFWVRSKVIDTETPENDTSVTLVARGVWLRSNQGVVIRFIIEPNGTHVKRIKKTGQ